MLLFALGTLILPPTPTYAQDVDLSVSLDIKGLTMEFPMAVEKNDYIITDPVLATVTFGGANPLVISEKKGLEAETVEEHIIALTQITPAPIISPRDPLIDPTPTAAVVIQESNTQLLLKNLPTPSIVPTELPVPTVQTPTPPIQSTPPVIQLSNGGLNADKLFDMANAHRASKGLPPFQKDERSCRLAAERAPEVAAEVANGNMHAGMYGRNLPYWNTENIISMSSEEAAFTWWINDGIHREAIEGNYTYSCVACHGNNCAQEFTNYQPK